MVEHPHYDQIIDAETYNRTIAKHLYIPESDTDIQEMLREQVRNMPSAEVLEAGCGPGCITGMIGEVPNVNLTAIDISPSFLDYARNIESIRSNARIRIEEADFSTYRHPQALDAAFTQGVHHHIEKGEKSDAYLANIHSQLKKDGAYFLGDEFLPEYVDARERQVRAVIWYAHIIDDAQRKKHGKLAVEEAKTLLDDLNEGAPEQAEKSMEQVRLVMDSVGNINTLVISGDMVRAETAAEEFLRELASLQKGNGTRDAVLAMSRGDFKISETALRAEMEKAGFEIDEKRVQGPLATIGAMAVFKLRPVLKKVIA